MEPDGGVLKVAPQPLRTNEMIARQKRLEAVFNLDIVRRDSGRPAEATVRSPDTDFFLHSVMKDIQDFSRRWGVQISLSGRRLAITFR